MRHYSKLNLAILVLALTSIAHSRALSAPIKVASTRAAVAASTAVTLTASSWSAAADVAMHLTLPPEDKPKTHWPWWLRILAVVGVLFFIRIVAGAVRSKPSGPPPV